MCGGRTVVDIQLGGQGPFDKVGIVSSALFCLVQRKVDKYDMSVLRGGTCATGGWVATTSLESMSQLKPSRDERGTLGSFASNRARGV